MDTLIIKALQVSTQIGAYTWEQHIRQPLLIDISFDWDFKHCNEDLTRTIDYAEICQMVTEFVENKTFKLIETVANEVAELIQKAFQIPMVTVGVSKPQAVKNAQNIQVIVQR